MNLSYSNTFSDNVFASIFAFRSVLKLFYSLHNDVINYFFFSYLLDHILDIYIIMYLSTKDEKIKSFLYNPCNTLFCVIKFSSLVLCIIIDTYNNYADLGVLNMFGFVYFFIFLLFKSSANLSQIEKKKHQNRVTQYHSFYSKLMKPCCKNDIKFSKECVFCIEDMENDICILSCKHAFHKNCFNKYIESCANDNKKVRCVICRKKMNEF